MSSDYKSKKRGVVTYINKELKPKLIKTSEDGSVLLREISKDDQKILIVNSLQIPIKEVL